MMKTVLSFGAGFIIGFLLIWAWNTYSDRPLREVAGETSTPDGIVVDDSNPLEKNQDSEGGLANEPANTTPESTKIDVRNQSSGENVILASVVLESDGWIVVHEEKNGLIGNALGAARRDAGTHQDVTIPLLRNTSEGSRYWVVLYSDDGDRQFSLRTDFPLRDSNENPITSSFQVQ